LIKHFVDGSMRSADLRNLLAIHKKLYGTFVINSLFIHIKRKKGFEFRGLEA